MACCDQKKQFLAIKFPIRPLFQVKMAGRRRPLFFVQNSFFSQVPKFPVLIR